MRMTTSVFDAMDEIFGKGYCQRPSEIGADMKHEDGTFTVELEIPGFPKKEIDIQVVDGILTVRAEAPEPQDNGAEYLHRSRKRNYHYQVKVGAKCDRDSIKAKLELGILTITFKEKEPDSHAIKIN